MIKKTFAFLALLVFCAGSAGASYISLQTSVTSTVQGDQLKVSVSAVNKGDEPAHNVQAELRVGNCKLMAKAVRELGIGGVYRAQASFKIGGLTPGQYPLFVAMHYADANLYPFSALTCQTFTYRSEAVSGDIFGSMRSASFWKNGKASVTLKNMGEEDLAALVYLVVPREITVAGGLLKKTLPAKSSERVDFEVENFSALSGSTYQVFAVSEYEKEGVHYAGVTPGLLRVAETQSILGVNYVYLAGALALLVLVFLAYQLKALFFKK